MLKEILIVILAFNWLVQETKCKNTSCQNEGKHSEKILCFSQEYSITLPPKNPKAFFKFRDVKIISIDLKTQAMVLNFDYHIHWYDDRIDFQDGVIGPFFIRKATQKFWWPRLKLPNLIDAQKYNFLGDVDVFAVYNDKNQTMVAYSSISKVEIACNMNFADFPFDSQECSLMVIS